MTARVPRVLTIAGMDSGGAAGVAADLKAFARCGAHGMAAIVALTAQNTVEVRGIHEVPPDFAFGATGTVLAVSYGVSERRTPDERRRLCQRRSRQ